MPSKIYDLHQKNRIDKLHKKLNGAANFIKEIQQKIDLSDLYEIFDYIKVPKDSEICPVFLEVKKNFDDDTVDRLPKAQRKDVKLYN